MSKSTNMLRTRRKDNNVKPNRRLDRKSSRGMLFENEELRLKTININAEVERSQSDVKKLKRENDELRREIWYLRDEYDKLDKLLREKESEDSSSSSCTSESDSPSSCSEESQAVEASQNLENFQKTAITNLGQQFDQLSVVPEENSENSEKNSNRTSVPENSWNEATEKNVARDDVIQPDQSYPGNSLSKAGTLPVHEKTPRHFFAPIRRNDEYANDQFLGQQSGSDAWRDQYQQNLQTVENGWPGLQLPPLSKSCTDVIVKVDNHDFQYDTLQSHSSFSNGGNLEELLNDIETISHDILQLSNPNLAGAPDPDAVPPDRPCRSELSVVLMPSPMQLIGMDKYKNIQKSCESLAGQLEDMSASCHNLRMAEPHASLPVPEVFPAQQNTLNEQNPFNFGFKFPLEDKKELYGSQTNLLDTQVSSEHVSSENEENLRFKAQPPKEKEKSDPKGIKHKVSIHFKGKNKKKNENKEEEKQKKTAAPEKKPFLDFKVVPSSSQKLQKTSSTDSKMSEVKTPTPKTPGAVDPKTPGGESKCSSDNKNCKTDSKNCESSSSDQKEKNRKGRKSSSASPERKHGQKDGKKHHRKGKKADKRGKRSSMSAERLQRERSYSICSDRSNILGHRGHLSLYDDFTASDRENSMSSCETLKGRKLSSVSHIPRTGKIPWCACWGNGCL